MYKVFINPGHDISCDPGACNLEKNINEAEIVLNIGMLVQRYLQTAGIETKLIQNDDLSYVCRQAEYFGANLFVSIHANAAENKYARGTEVLIYKSGGQAAIAADYVHEQIVNEFIDELPGRYLKERPNLYVLKATSMPAILVECAFISNDEDSELLINNQDNFAKAIARGITDYFSYN